MARLGANDTDIARAAIARITAADRARWSSGTPLDWALETYAVSKEHAYGPLPAEASRCRRGSQYRAFERLRGRGNRRDGESS